MEPGLMRHKITFQRQSTERNSLGELDSRQWDDVISVRASINPVSGREFVSGMAEHSEVTHKVTIRYCKDIKPNMRIVFGSRIFEILHIIDTWEMHSEMTLMCRELVT